MRHIHLSEKDFVCLFGAGKHLTRFKDLSQPGQFAANEKLDVIGPSGTIKSVRILGPFRKQTQVEVSRTDSYVLGLDPPVRDSGDLSGSAPCRLVGPAGSIELAEGVIIAQRHIHMTPGEASFYKVSDKEKVSVFIRTQPLKRSASRDVCYFDVLIRVNERFALDFHMDADEANAAGVGAHSECMLIKTSQDGKPLFLAEKNEYRMNKKLVSEDDIHLAHEANCFILIKKNMILTPQARETGDRLNVLKYQ